MPGVVRARRAARDAPAVTRVPAMLRGCFGLFRFAAWVDDYLNAARRRNEEAAVEETRQYMRAKRRSLALMLSLMSPAQREEFRRYRYFHVTGGESGTGYRIRVASYTNIDVIGPTGSTLHHLCVRPWGDVPVYDVMAAQMLHLQDATTEMRFLRCANVHPVVPQRRRNEWSFWVP
jgi:hypothetical protein